MATTELFLRLNQICYADLKIRENTDRNWLAESEDGRCISGFEAVNDGALAERINNPVFPHTGSHIDVYKRQVNQYLEDISAQDDVIDLMNRVQVVFNEAVMQDDTLNNYLAQLKEDLQVEVGEALAEAETCLLYTSRCV